MAVKPIPQGYGGAIPYLSIRNAAAAIDFYKRAFGATELLRMTQPDGRVGHAELHIAGAVVMLADEFPEMDIRSPQALGGSPVTIHLYVEDVDRFAARAIGAGLEVLRPIADQFYGDRSGFFQDPFGHRWSFSTHQEDVPPEELHRRHEALAKQRS
jgi:PhnB protein